MKNIIWLVLASFMFVVIGCADDDASTLPDNTTPSAADYGIDVQPAHDRLLGEKRAFGATAWDTDAIASGDTDLWVSITGGTFTMGDDNAYTAEAPAHDVTVADFEIMRYEITNSLFRECVMDTDPALQCTAPGVDYTVTYDDTDTTDTDPGVATDTDATPWCEMNNYDLIYNGTLHQANGAMTCLNFSQAQKFCAWIGGRLPTEAEWEYAARSGGQPHTWPWEWDTADVDSDTWADCDHAMMMTSLVTEEAVSDCGLGWYVNDGPCGVYPTFSGQNATEQGLCDMVGNVAEWVADVYHPDYVGAPTDGSAWMDTDNVPEARVIRGGHSGNFAGWVRNSSRSYNKINHPWGDGNHASRSYGPIGARCVRDVP